MYFLFDGVEKPTQIMNKTRTYIFDQSDVSNLMFGGEVEVDEENRRRNSVTKSALFTI